MDASEEYGEVPNIDRIFLLEMKFQLVFRDPLAGELQPGPVMFLSHDSKQPVAELVSRQSFPRHPLVAALVPFLGFLSSDFGKGLW